eukprot:m.42092 g.42092  ORF g.42092 m.42092 type:complete len:333 (-) comp10647_c0_seq1:438-1436(-)
MSLELSGVVNCCQFGRAPTTTHRLAVGVDETITLLTLSRVDGVAQVGGVPQQYVLDLECTLALEVVPLAISWSPKLDMQVAKDGASEDIVPFSPLAFAGDDKCVYALSFSVENPSMFQVQRGEGHTEAINAVDYNGTGEFIVSAGDDCTVRVWNNEAMYLTTIPFKQPIADVKFAPLGKLHLSDATRLLAADRSGVVHLLDIGVQQPLRSFSTTVPALYCLDWSSIAPQYVLAGNHDDWCIWDYTASSVPCHGDSTEKEGRVLRCKFFNSHENVFALATSKSVQILSLDSSQNTVTPMQEQPGMALDLSAHVSAPVCAAAIGNSVYILDASA